MSKIDLPIKLANEAAVQFTNAIRLKAVRCGNDYRAENFNKVFIDGLPLTNRSIVRVAWGRDLGAHLAKLAQHSNTLPDLQHREVKEIRIEPRRLCGGMRGQRWTFVAAVVETKDVTISTQSEIVINKHFVPPQRFGAANSGQFKHYRVCQEKDHSIDKCKLASKQLATLRDANFPSGYRNWCRSLRSRDWRNTSFRVRSQYQNRDDRSRSHRASEKTWTTAAPPQQQPKHQSHSAAAQRKGSNPNALTVLA